MSTDSSCLILCPPDQNCDPSENARCRTSLFKVVVALLDDVIGISSGIRSMRWERLYMVLAQFRQTLLS